MNRPAALAYTAVPPGGSGPPVLVIHSWWGLTGSFIDIADRLAAAGFLVGCADLYAGRTASSVEGARTLRRTKRKEPAYRLLQRALQQMADHPAATRIDPAVIGFSMGGHWAVWLAQHPPPAVSATVLFYSARAGDYSRATAPMLAHFAQTDSYVSQSARDNMERAVTRHGLSYRCYEYPETGHWFAESAHRAYDEEATAAALDRTVALLKETRSAARRPN